MANYVILLNWTDQGVATARETVTRSTQLTAALRKMGGKMKNVLWTIGAYDVVLTVEAPDDETVTAFCLDVAAAGNARTTTMRAFDRTEMAGILERVPG